MKCPHCGHDIEMHWAPADPAMETTACRDCLPRSLYVHSINVSGPVSYGMCCWPQADIKRALDLPAPAIPLPKE